MNAMDFPVFAKGASPLDSKNRQKVIEIDVKVEIGNCLISPGDIVVADMDGIVIIPQELEAQAISLALEKVAAENTVRDAIKNGLSATAAFKKYGVL
jgi:regulator of RNase E activity RraA